MRSLHAVCRNDSALFAHMGRRGAARQMISSPDAQSILGARETSSALWSGFIESAKTFPQRPALWVAGRVATYAELCDAAQRIAATLQAERAEGGAPLTAVFAQRGLTGFAGVCGAPL